MYNSHGVNHNKPLGVNQNSLFSTEIISENCVLTHGHISCALTIGDK